MTQAMAVEEPPSGRIRTWLLNPFYYVAGGQALLAGLAALMASGLLSIATNSHFDGIIDFHTGLKAAWWFHFGQGFLDWLVMSTLLFIGGLALSPTRFRALDVFGTQALARLPGLVMVLVQLPPPVRRVNDHMASAVQNGQLTNLFDPADPMGATLFTIGVLAVVVMVVWMVMWMYRAFSVSCNVSGGKAIGVFVGALLVGEVITKLALYALRAHAML